ncbi:hypothetical protein BH10PLA1_BH10PLA1_20660 [soil metagenome]
MLKHTLKLAVLLAASASAAWADSSAVPATMPTAQPAPATQPSESAEVKVLVLPFAPLQPNDPEWIGRAIQQSVAADLSRPTNGQSLQAMNDGKAAVTTADAIDAGRSAGAQFVVYGSYQLIEPSLKLTGQVIEVSTGRVLGGLKSTGSVRELFDMQDTLAFQARWALGMNQLAQKKLPAAPVSRPQVEPQGPILVGADRYDGSELSKAVSGGVSLIDSYDAAGTSYRQQYFDDSRSTYYPWAYSYGYGGYGGWYGYVPTQVIYVNHGHDRDCDRSRGANPGRNYPHGVYNNFTAVGNSSPSPITSGRRIGSGIGHAGIR